MTDRSQIVQQRPPKISVIIPVYNRESQIGDAIDSVLAQTEKNWELIIVDDGSQEETGAICDRYMAADQRIRVLHTEHRGVSAARNTGLQEARGEWIMFLDSDDAYEPDAFRLMLNYSVGMDLVVASMRYAGTERVRSLLTDKKVYKDWFATIEQDFHHLYTGFFYSSVCAKLYRRAMITTAFDLALGYAEDIMFNLHIMPGLKRICVLPEACYVVMYRLGESHGQKAELMQLEVQKNVLGSWRCALGTEYPAQLSYVFRRYIEFVLKFMIKLLRAERLPVKYRLAILSAQLDSMLVDERQYGFDKLPDSHQAFWRLLRTRNVDALLSELPKLEKLCFEKPLEIYQKGKDGTLRAIGDGGANG